MSHVATVDRRGGITDTISDVFFARPKLLTLLLLLPPLLWLGIVYLGSLFALLLQSFFRSTSSPASSSTSSRSRPTRELLRSAPTSTSSCAR